MDFSRKFDSCKVIPIENLMEILKGYNLLEIGNELKPSDLYCYLYAKYGAPNGIQNILRDNTSDNLVHWEWAIGCVDGLILIQGMNLRTEMHFIGEWKLDKGNKKLLIKYIKSDFANFGKGMTDIRKKN